jgi:hypothetical protein
MLVNTGVVSQAGLLRTDFGRPISPIQQARFSLRFGQAWRRTVAFTALDRPASRHSTDGFYEFLDKNPEFALVFDQAMDSVVGRFASSVAAACDLQDARVIVDVGAGRGTLLATILSRNTHAKGILFDLDGVVSGAGQHLESMGVSERCSRLAGDFFQSVPQGGDVYVLSHVLHNWDDDSAFAILRKLPQRHGRRSPTVGSGVADRGIAGLLFDLA